MNFQAFSITSSGAAKRPRILLHGAWLARMGFKPDMLIQALPEPGGIILRCCDDNIPKYSTLVQETQAKGGKLIRGCCEQGLTLVTSGDYIRSAGLAVGDACIARYDYGIIRVRKLPPQTRVLLPKSPDSKIRLICGTILTSNGFIPGSLAFVKTEPGKIEFLLHGQDAENYRTMMKYARANQMSLMQVINAAGVIRVQIPDLCLQRAGFFTDDAFLAHYDHGLISLTNLDFEALGF